ncbi:hypothetical protein LTR10_013501 [Elasticomyces elasticus]|uniref:Cryptic loci regulator 2 N-terminal domain-containing protein n=1 Tax=Exophiala sideris TaxID=1016849 RepID=A0ABR0JQD1_9EURO|nr:hypothetical protein LTR10_013501 [Elasticomyces elasticus]KAK5039637.1 hypothetical protein LTS07_000131 [Exophiala sideris]KAK5041189.1 hypothetical protein LTR13_002663 [Exophiala sideris]KAK5068014.1 hypothetical protein LTR69_000131 [Exophiala sideris]KAK5187316.1 hypothetical protein LTR44_000131 [Eurotiomycetes sp. CCFEE 6388]
MSRVNVVDEGSKSVAAFCNELGMKAETQRHFRTDTRSYLQSKFSDLPNTTDEAIGPVAKDYLEAGPGSIWFSQHAGLKYQWNTAEHRPIIFRYIYNIMKKQRWYAIDILHQRLNRQHQRLGTSPSCPGCLAHPTGKTPRRTSTDLGAPNHPIDLGNSSDVSDAGSIHHVTTRESTPDTVESKKRPRTSHDYRTLSGAKKREMPASVETESITVAPSKRHRLHHKSTVSKSTLKSPYKEGSSTSASPEPELQTQPEKVISLKYADASIKYRGKVWRFESIAHKAKVLELILLQEEKEVESYPIMAFSKGAQKAAPGSEDDDEGIGSADVVRDYFRFYTHFMNERFPGNERLLLENGVQPSA